MLKDFVLRHRIIFAPLLYLRRLFRELKLFIETKRVFMVCKKVDKAKIYYIGIPAHSNLGDLAQGVCIRRWLKKHYSDYCVVEIETNALVNTHFSLLKLLKKDFNDERDFIVFQSGYTTTDLGGFADIMHKAVMEVLPTARVLMMPQTIFFKTKVRKEQCSKIYNNQKRMLFLARDKVSYDMAKEMFPEIEKRCFPDIVTTLIGTKIFNTNRDGIIFCLRNDVEKFYSDDDLKKLIEKCKTIGNVNRTDTTKNVNVVNRAEEFINTEISEYSKYKVMVTDRYHGTILALVAGTPVVIVKSTDHKVITGADWFKGVYDNYVYVAEDLDDAYNLVKRIYSRNKYPQLKSYFQEEYYDKLPGIFENLK